MWEKSDSWVLVQYPWTNHIAGVFNTQYLKNYLRYEVEFLCELKIHQSNKFTSFFDGVWQDMPEHAQSDVK